MAFWYESFWIGHEEILSWYIIYRVRMFQRSLKFLLALVQYI